MSLPSKLPLSLSPRSSPSAPLLLRTLTTLLPVLALILLITTLHLFHLHHAHPHPEDDISDLQHAYGTDESGPNSPGGSALRHKMDLADFLLKRHDHAQRENEILEAQQLGGWRGGNEENFIKLVKEKSVFVNQTLEQNERDISNVGDISNVDAVATLTKENKTTNLTNGESNDTDDDDDDDDDGTDSSQENILTSNLGNNTMSNWTDFQKLLLDGNFLHEPIPRVQTARGYSGLPMSETPALVGAHRGQITCPGTDPKVQKIMSSMLAFWNENRGIRDDLADYSNTKLFNKSHPHPFLPAPLPPFDPSRTKLSQLRKKYLTFEPDSGGWNNLRMSFENIVLYAAMSGRTLVLPPDQMIYLLEPKKGDSRRWRNYNDIFNLTDNFELLRRVPIITAEEFLAIEGKEGGLAPLKNYNLTWQNHLWSVSRGCEERKKSDVFCEDLYDHYARHGQIANISAEFPYEACFIFDSDVFVHGPEYVDKLSPKIKNRINQFCALRSHQYYTQSMHNAPIWHFKTMDSRYRLLVHFYLQNFFTDPVIDNYYKRFIRDFLRYHDEVFCAAGKIILALQYEEYSLSSDTQRSPIDLNSELVDGFSSLHVRRGDLQFKEVKLSAADWYENTKEIWKPREVLYIATDETSRPWFDSFRNNHSGPLRFLIDYKELTELERLDPTLYGMIDTVVASRGRMFAGTWFSTFTGYIMRLRGYYGMSKFSNYFSWIPRKYYMHNWMDAGKGTLYAREYPIAWTSIDGDAFVSDDREGNLNPFLGSSKNKEVNIVWSGNYSTETGTSELSREKGQALIDPSNGKSKDTKEETHVGGYYSVARGVSSLPFESSKALIGAKRGHISCDIDVDNLAYWNDPQGYRDYIFKSPFRDKSPNVKTKYLAFSPDRGGFNNVRMSFEIMFVLAAAMGRVLVLPPKQPMYMLRNDASNKHLGLNHFFDMKGQSFRKRVSVVSMEEFLLREGSPGGQFPAPVTAFSELIKLSSGCDHKEISCGKIHEYLVQYGVTPNITATHHQCFVFDEMMYNKDVPENSESVDKFCGSGNRKVIYYTKQFEEPQLLYIQAGTPATRMLSHFYGYIHFTNPAIDNYFKRYVRDLLHFREEIFCAAGKVINMLHNRMNRRGFIGEADTGSYSALHIRRGDFQYSKMKLTADEWYRNTVDVLIQNETLYIATDEKDKSFFDPFISAGHKLFFLDDFRDLVNLDNVDPNHMGMIDTIVATQGRAFIGTYRSTFSGYINRLRGYYGMSMKNSWYGTIEHKTMMHDWSNVNLDTYAKEWPDAWIGIDGDESPSKDKF